MRAITGAEDVNIWGACSGGITTSALLAHLAARGSRKVHSATLAVCVLDMQVAQDTTAGMFVTPETILAAKAASQLAGVVEGRELARMFAWMRPNDLVWNYWVNNYLMGNAPPAFDILYWNSDTTRLAAGLHADFLDLIDANPFVRPGLAARARHAARHAPSRPRQLRHRRPDRPHHALAGCYRTARLYGERTTFVLSNSGHIQSLLNPPGNPKAFFHCDRAFRAQVRRRGWKRPRNTRAPGGRTGWSGSRRARATCAKAPTALGHEAHPPLCAAPGEYVLEK